MAGAESSSASSSSTRSLIVDRGDIELAKLKGSWAGALGQVQFMPSSYLASAVDFDKDGDRDVWASMPDVFGSIGNYLQQHGWTPGRWGYAVKIPDAAREKVISVPLRDEGCRAVRTLSQPRALKDWRTLGVRLASGQVPCRHQCVKRRCWQSTIAPTSSRPITRPCSPTTARTPTRSAWRSCRSGLRRCDRVAID